LALSGSEISGTPTATGTFNIILKAENSAGSDTKAFSMIFTEAQNAPVITTTSLDDGRMDIGYSQSLTATGTSPITWSVIDGSLPPGLVLYPTGDIAGTPMEDGTFTFTVKAENIKDSDTLTTSIKIVAVPSAPGNFTLSPLNGEVVLTWTTPDRGPAIVKYQVSYGEADGYMTDWNDIAGSGPGTVTYTVTGLTNDTEYTFEVRAVSSEGDGDTSGILSATPSATATEPSAPRNLKAAAGDGDVVLTWRIPSNDGGSEITSYVVYCDASDGSTTNSFSDVGTALTYTVTGLINGTEYEFRVAAVNDAGEGVSSVTVTATPSGSAGTSEGGPNGGSGGDNGMILIAVGIVAAVVIVGAVYFFVIRKP
ncbi:MAG: fibronectin type III domain-containing protein, partial [Methanomassiliicoccaceae archaeon]|nr:fibronectin type III domain-containing protein [Methanomassiliicoccaceae archaeon]